jgi:hypothetical protein
MGIGPGVGIVSVSMTASSCVSLGLLHELKSVVVMVNIIMSRAEIMQTRDFDEGNSVV